MLEAYNNGGSTGNLKVNEKMDQSYKSGLVMLFSGKRWVRDSLAQWLVAAWGLLKLDRIIWYVCVCVCVCIRML